MVTLYHGDCRAIREWLAADVLVTDPPYGVGYTSRRTGSRVMAGDRSTLVRDGALALWADRGPAAVFGSWKVQRPAGVRQLVVWDKRGGAGYSGDLRMPFADVCEEVYLMGQGWAGRRRPNILTHPTIASRAKGRPAHPTPKPVPLFAELLSYAPPGVVADPFAGSGPLALAARQLGRRAILVEIDEAYCELIARRLQDEPLNLDVRDVVSHGESVAQGDVA